MKVNWEEEGFQIIGDASNGQEAIEWLREKEIDLILTDMRMPIMDGLQLAKHCHDHFSHVKVIVLSGYSDFEYVRGSLKEGVRDYLLKPVAPEELEEALRKIRKEGKEEKKKLAETAKVRQLALSRLQEVQEQYLLYLVKEDRLLLPMVKERLIQLQLEGLVEEKTEVQFISVEIRESMGNTHRLKELWMPFQMICKELAREHAGLSFYDPSYTNMVHFIKSKNGSEDLVRDIQQNIKKLICLETVIGIGNPIKGISEFKSGYISSMLAWSQSYLGQQSQIIDVSNIKEDVFEFSSYEERKLLNAIENADFALLKVNIEQLLNRNKSQSILSFSFVANRILFLLGSIARKYDTETKDIQKAMWTCQQSIWELNSYEKVIQYLVDLAGQIIKKVRTARFSNGKLIIDGVRQYLDQHYANEISLSLLSEIFHINKAHLSETFKSQIGQNFSDYLVRVRMEKAVDFLEDRHLKIIDVANLVGFTNSGYFSTVFKKYYGKTPVDYRQCQNKQS
ncbi:response regulator transcription factor [Fictibacillus fluitans]|uniref:Response regulator n=1 Tax=Fictibacillus fluitans TaxID=3058422 RepID=A0ABT8HXX8_9BACL|nr:response regulator [Fictibacillus sp. NE201]MDN4525637.1 response regulator [Fictibacillus sp. NE201]